ncbi:MAG: hypothetical protein ACRDRT_04735 [Pseudonocardiaceae bacterium]
MIYDHARPAEGPWERTIAPPVAEILPGWSCSSWATLTKRRTGPGRVIDEALLPPTVVHGALHHAL